ncbi:hypothetical protein OJJOAM_000982 [Cupriavidus sp. H18C1]
MTPTVTITLTDSLKKRLDDAGQTVESFKITSAFLPSVGDGVMLSDTILGQVVSRTWLPKRNELILFVE